ncbi:hypothetical protein GCM10009123_05450 [Kangiella japonica]|uniref:Uncharacterized protein n=1 Tax=Kangiella japonica TaxID=647384 RepID=A0ABP3CEF7_9GAMM
MSNDNDLLNQLNQLPSEAKAPDRWSQIEQAIESERQPQKQAKKKQQRWTYAVAACAVLVAALSPLYLEQGNNLDDKAVIVKTVKEQTKTPNSYLLTIGSLQQANAYFYARLGYQIKHGEQMVSVETLDSLKSLRQAQQDYRKALVKQPQSEQIQERLFWLYQKERHLLRQLVV